MNQELNSVDDIDKMLDAEYLKLESENDEGTVKDNDSGLAEEPSEKTPEESSESEGEQSQESKGEEAEEGTPEVKVEKPTKDEQISYSFKNLREERDNYKKQSEQYEGDSTFLKELASIYGYTDVEKFKKDLRDAQLEKEAQSKGVDPTMYKKLSEQDEKIKQLENESRTRELNLKAEKFNREVDAVVNELNLGENGAEIIFQKLAENGFTQIDQVLDLPNVKPLLMGILSDYVTTSAEQKQIKAIEKAKSLSDEPANDSGTNTSVSLDDIIAKEMKQYKEDNFF